MSAIEPPALPEAVDTRRKVVQIAYTVDDLWAAAQEWHDLTGAGPFFITEHIPVEWATHDGEAAVYDHSTALGQWGPVMIELVVHHEVSPPSLADAVGTGELGINHVAWFVEDLEEERERLTAGGAREVLHASTGPVTFAFFEPASPTGHLIECYEAKGRLRGLYRMVRDASIGWDGSDPVRRL